MVYRVEDMRSVEGIFGYWEESLLWSCLEGVMGDVYVTDRERPQAAMAVNGDFCFFAGRPERELVLFKPDGHGDFIIMAPQSEAWSELIEDCYGERAQRTVRFAIKKEPGIFDTVKLQAAVDALPAEYTLRMLDGELYERCKAEEWSRDWVSLFGSYEMYERLGLGVVILKDGEIVAGASSYSRYKEGIEIQIDTREDYRRKGLAYVSGAALILECLKRGLYPSWDAQNRWSVGLAQKLGYHYDSDYIVYEIRGY